MPVHDLLPHCTTRWDGAGPVFDHGRAWNGRSAEAVVTSLGDGVAGIETVDVVCGRGVLLDVGRGVGTDGELPYGFAITEEHLEHTVAAQGASAAVGRGDIVVVRTGQLSRAPGSAPGHRRRRRPSEPHRAALRGPTLTELPR